ncbi:MAG: nuclear transport factor 2 family protein [Deltaproteobacteria bacterium]|nr:nuclear transport factor 2 family protein [Deltaproteobacteria bacterium]
MNKNIADIAEAYYAAMVKKDLDELATYLHPDVRFSGFIGNVKGKETFLESLKKFVDFFETLKIRAKFGSGNQAMVVYDLKFPEPIGEVPTASLMTIEDGLISKIELFFDGRPFEQAMTSTQ